LNLPRREERLRSGEDPTRSAAVHGRGEGFMLVNCPPCGDRAGKAARSAMRFGVRRVEEEEEEREQRQGLGWIEMKRVQDVN
jgi:arginase family enzyme